MRETSERKTKSEEGGRGRRKEGGRGVGRRRMWRVEVGRRRMMRMWVMMVMMAMLVMSPGERCRQEGAEKARDQRKRDQSAAPRSDQVLSQSPGGCQQSCAGCQGLSDSEPKSQSSS
eukprot:7332732-Pyramimonas_sp.AAC.4